MPSALLQPQDTHARSSTSSEPDSSLRAIPDDDNAQVNPLSRSKVSSSQGVDSPDNTRKYKVRHVRTSDISAFQIGSFKRWLHFHLSRLGALDGPKTQTERTRTSMEDIDIDIQPFLQGVLDLFNEKDSDGNINLEDKCRVKTSTYHAIMAELVAYADTTDEQSRYVHFVKASNMVFEALGSMKMLNSKPAPAFDGENAVMFMVNHPTRMYSEYKGETYSQTPSVLLGYKKHVQNIYPQASDSVPLPEFVTEGPSQPFPWSQALMFVEMESISETLTTPPPSYTPRVLAERQSIPNNLESESRGPSMTEAAGAKHDTDHASDPRSSKKRKTDSGVEQDGEIPFNIMDDVTYEIRKLADSAAEAMYNCYGRNHVLGFFLTGSTLNIWIFDHSGPIQLLGFDFIQDFPYYLLLLYVLQRFTPEDYGFLPGFHDFMSNDEVNYSADLTNFWISEDESNRQVKLEGACSDGVPHKYGLKGRSTGVRFGTATISESGRQDEGRRVALKLSWKDTSRKCEREFIDRARKLIGSSSHATEDDTNPRNFLSEILAERKYTEFDTSIIRSVVLLDPDEVGSCYPYMIVMPRYEPICTLVKDFGFPLLNAFLALIYCHAVLWSLGIQHGDISEHNLMVDPTTGHPKLCDFDLSHFQDDTRSSGFSNTGTWAFMAAELLTGSAMKGFTKRHYRHEVESFIAVLVWLLLRYENGQLISNPPLSEWNSTSYEICAAKRKHTFEDIIAGTLAKPDWLSSAIWDGLAYAVYELVKLNHEFGYLLSKSMMAARKIIPMKAEEVERLEYLSGIGYVGEVVKYSLCQVLKALNGRLL